MKRNAQFDKYLEKVSIENNDNLIRLLIQFSSFARIDNIDFIRGIAHETEDVFYAIVPYDSIYKKYKAEIQQVYRQYECKMDTSKKRCVAFAFCYKASELYEDFKKKHSKI